MALNEALLQQLFGGRNTPDRNALLQGFGSPYPGGVNPQGSVAPTIANILAGLNTQQAPAPQPSPVPTSVPIPASIPITPPTRQPDRAREEFVNAKGDQASASNKRKSMFFDLIKRIGVPLGATIAGTVNPNLLPGAAGLATGYNEGYNRQEDIIRQMVEEQQNAYKDVAEYNPESGKYEIKQRVKKGTELKSSRIPSEFEIQKEARLTANAIISNNPKLQADAIDNPQVFGDIVEQQAAIIRNRVNPYGLDVPQTKAGDAVKKVEEIIIVTKDGKEWELPESQLDEAIQQGYKEVK